MRKVFCICLLLMLFLSHAALAIESTAYTYTISIYGQAIRTQDAYMPGSVMLRELEMKSPEDLYLLGKSLYIADTGNARILRYDMNTGLVTVIGKGTLKEPTGVCVSPDGTIYVADYIAPAIVVFDKDGVLLREIKRPADVLYGTSTAFKPQKVALDGYGNLYAASEGTHEGILQYDIHGRFAGFFGANKVGSLDFTQWLTDKVYTQEQKDKQARRNPPRIVSLAVSRENLVYSLTQQSRTGAVKRLNMAGVNTLPARTLYADNNVVDIDVGSDNVFYTVTDAGNITEYSAEGMMLFAFGGRAVSSDRNGLTSVVSAICVDSDHNLYVLDKQRGVIQPYAATDFAREIHQGLSLFASGRYAESADIWQDYIRLSPQAMFAHSGYGLAMWQTGRYKDAYYHLNLAGEMEYASEAYWELRNDWLMANLPTIIVLLVILCTLSVFVSFLNRKFGILKLLKQGLQKVAAKSHCINVLRNMKSILGHPLDTLYDIKHNTKGNLSSASVLYVLALIVYMVDVVFSAQLFNNWLLTNHYSNPGIVAGIVALPAVLFVIGNYFIASINDGEGSMHQVVISMGYALSFYIIVTPFLTLLTYVLTLNEAFILTLLRIVVYGYSIVLIYLSAKQIHAYSFWQTIKNLLLTICFVVLAMLAIAILYLLWHEVISFVETLIEEVQLRA